MLTTLLTFVRLTTKIIINIFQFAENKLLMSMISLNIIGSYENVKYFESY